MKPKTHSILFKAIEDGIDLGYARAHKHDNSPSENLIKDKILDAIIESVYEYFDFEGVE